MIWLFSTALEPIGVALIGIPIVHLFFVRVRVNKLHKQAGLQNRALVEVVEDAELRNAVWPGLLELSLVAAGLALNIAGLLLRFALEFLAHLS